MVKTFHESRQGHMIRVSSLVTPRARPCMASRSELDLTFLDIRCDSQRAGCARTYTAPCGLGAPACSNMPRASQETPRIHLTTGTVLFRVGLARDVCGLTRAHTVKYSRTNIQTRAAGFTGVATTWQVPLQARPSRGRGRLWEGGRLAVPFPELRPRTVGE